MYVFEQIEVFVLQLFEMIVESEDISDEKKARICKRLGEADKVSLRPLCMIRQTCKAAQPFLEARHKF